MEKYLEIIKESPIFSGIEDRDILTMFNCLKARRKAYKQNEFILLEGEQVDSMGIVLEGSVLILQEDYWGNRNIIGKVTKSGIFAEAFACSNRQINVMVVAEKDCHVLWLSVGKMLTVCSSMCDHHSKMIRNLLSVLAEKNLNLNEKLMHTGQRSIRSKVLSYLSAQSQKLGLKEFDIPYNRQQLADFLSVDRSALSAELSKLREEKIIDFKKNHFIIK